MSRDLRIRRRIAPCEKLPTSLHPVLRRVFANRGVTDAGELEMDLAHLHPFDTLCGIEPAVALLKEALAGDWPILVVGDYDVDGATSTALALRALKVFGASDVSYLVPDRFRYGYGLTPAIVEVAQMRSPKLLITVDNGISSIDGVRAARAAGMRVLVTDHHLPGSELPPADAIVNPNQLGCRFPSKHLAGVGVIFYTLLALRTALRGAGWFQGRIEPNMSALLDLVALGTVADLVRLDRNNRILVSHGLGRIRRGRAVPGVIALLEAGGRVPGRVTTADLGFAAGPRLNAAGRLDDMSIGIECLLTDDIAEARRLAGALDGLNRERREIEVRMQSEALEALANLDLDAEPLPIGLCLFDESWHQGVVGLLASRVKDRYHRPVVAFAPAEAGSDTLKGSARSVPGLHIRDALEAVSTRHPNLIERFGGHAMAAGLSLERRQFDAFSVAFDAEARLQLAPAQLEGAIHSDGELAACDLNLELAALLRDAAPWGQGFAEPSFDGEFHVQASRIVGERHLKLRLRTLDGDTEIDGIAFNQANAGVKDDVIHAVYRLDVNEYRGTLTPQIVIEYMQHLR